MKQTVPPELEKGRAITGPWRSIPADGWNGAFRIKHQGRWFHLLISDGGGWEHVSVEVYQAGRCPTWREMCWVKDLCWKPDEVAIQIHPAQANYINVHPDVLHLWRPVEGVIPLPPVEFV